MTGNESSGDVWVEDRSWHLADEPRRRCRWMIRRQACGRPGVAYLVRGVLRPTHWYYCAEHLYGRRINDGRIEVRVRAGSPAAERGWTNV